MSSVKGTVSEMYFVVFFHWTPGSSTSRPEAMKRFPRNVSIECQRGERPYLQELAEVLAESLLIQKVNGKINIIICLVNNPYNITSTGRCNSIGDQKLG